MCWTQLHTNNTNNVNKICDGHNHKNNTNNVNKICDGHNVVVSSTYLIYVICVVFVFVCLRPVSCVPDVASASGLSILDRPFCFLECLFKSDERDI
jgi:hypothetical protein